jgi:chromate reductase
LEVVEIGPLPLYDRDLDDGDNPPSAWTEFRQRMTGYDAVLFVTPGYDRSLPASLKNAIERGLTPVWS